MKKVKVTKISEAHDGFDTSYLVDVGDVLDKRENIVWYEDGVEKTDPYLDGYRKAIMDIALKEVEIEFKE